MQWVILSYDFMIGMSISLLGVVTSISTLGLVELVEYSFTNQSKSQRRNSFKLLFNDERLTGWWGHEESSRFDMTNSMTLLKDFF